MKNTQKKFLSAVLAASSVAGVVAPAATVFASTTTEVQTLVDNLVNAKVKTFYDFNTAYAAIMSLPADQQGKYLDQIAKFGDVVRPKGGAVDVAMLAIDEFYKTQDMATYNKTLLELIPKIENATDKTYVNDELGKWGMIFIADKQKDYIAATDAINAVNKALADGKLDEARALAKDAQAAIDKVAHANNKKYLTEVTLPEVVGRLDAATTTKVSSATAVGAKKIEVKFGKAVDTTKAVFAVKREAIKVNTSSITWNADKTVATIELASKISAANYTVEVTGLDTTTLSGTFVGKDEKVTKISILSNDAPLADHDGDGNIDDLSVAYKVYNQYDEDITKVTSVVASSSGTTTTVDQTKGIVKITGNFDAYVSNKAVVTLVNTETGVSATSTLNVVAQAKVGEVKVVGLYNKDGKTLTEATNLATDKFYLEIQAKDQYGNAINPTNIQEQILYSQSNNTVIKLDETTKTVAGQTVNVLNVLDTVVDGKYYVQLVGVTGTPVVYPKLGESIATLISSTTGKSSAFTVKVGEGTRAESVSLSQPDLVAQNEDAYLPLTVFDKNGAEIKDLTLINDSVRGITVSGGNVVLKDGAVFVKVDAAANAAEGIKTVVVTVKGNYKVTSINYTVKAAAVPKVIAGLKSSIKTQLNGGVTQDIKAENLTIEDQYGRAMSSSKVNSWVNAGNSIKVDSTLGATTGFAVQLNGGADSASNVLASSTDKVTVVPNAAAGTATSEKLTFTLQPAGLPLTSSAKDVVFSKSAIAEYASYKVTTPEAIFNFATRSFELKVYGVKADGTEVLLDNTNYNLVLPSGAVFNNSYANGVNTVSLVAALPVTTIDNDSTNTVPESKEYTFTVTIGNDAATQVAQKVKVSAATEKIAEIGFTTDGKHGSSKFDGSNFVVDGTVLNNIDLARYAYGKDQYGTYSDKLSTFDSITFSNLIKSTNSTASINVATNGSAAASVSNLQAGDRITVTVAKDNATKTLELTVVSVGDLTAPAAPTIAPLPAITNAATVIVTGVTEVGSTITVSGGTAAVPGTVDAAGNYTATVALNPNAVNNLSVVAKDAANNASTAATVAITHDNTAPAAPVITTLAQTVNAATITVAGTAEANATVTIIGGAAPATITANAAGAYSVTVNLTQDIANTLTATATDAASNTSVPSAPVVITEDSTAPVVTGVTEGQTISIATTPAGVTPVFTEGTATLDGVAYTSGTAVTTVGVHVLVVTDAAGNVTTRNFTITA